MFMRLSRWFRQPSALRHRSRSGRALSLECLEARTLLTGPEISVLDAFTPITSGSGAVIDLGSIARGNAGPIRTFTLRNDGDAPLLVNSMSLPAGFTLVDPPSTILVPRSSDKFSVQLQSAAVGTHQGVIILGNNDADEGSFAFSVRGTVLPNGPEIVVLLGETPIEDTAPAAIPWPGVVVGEPGPVQTFTIRNDGNQPLSISNVSGPAGFAVVGSIPGNVAPQSTGTLSIRLLSTTAGRKSGEFHILSNDPDLGDFDFPITGLVTATAAPSLTLLYGPTELPSGNSTVNFGKAVMGGTGPLGTFTVRNDGTAPLDLDSLTLPAGFNLVNGLVPSLDPTESDTFLVQLDTSVVASFEGNLSIGSNDPNNDSFQVRVAGDVVANSPEIRVFHDDSEITSGGGDPVEFGSVSQGTPGSKVAFFILNFGVKELTLGGVTLPAGFKLFSGLPARLAPDMIATMVVQLDSKVPGTQSGEISIKTNDVDENPFRIPVTGTVLESEPEISVVTQGKALTDGATAPLAFGDGYLGQSGPTRTFTVRNDGKAVLALGALTVPTGFTVVEGLASTLASRASDTFTVRLDTTVLGDYSGEISLVSSDADESPFNFSIRSRVTVAPVPHITVSHGGTVLTSGDSTAIDLGSVAWRKKGPSLSLTIRNDGAADLNVLNMELPSGFVLAKRPPKRIAPQRAVVFQLRLDSRVVGFRTGQLVIHSDDAAIASFVIAIQGLVQG